MHKYENEPKPNSSHIIKKYERSFFMDYELMMNGNVTINIKNINQIY